jgi:hypothetical protein
MSDSEPAGLSVFGSGITGDDVHIEAVRYRRGQRHVVLIHLKWHPKWGRWRLVSYLERNATMEELPPAERDHRNKRKRAGA